MAAILDHLKHVSLKADVNKMSTQNLAVCFGPVLLCPSVSPSASDAEVANDFKRHIEVLSYLLDIWPDNRGKGKTLCFMSWRKFRGDVMIWFSCTYIIALVLRVIMCKRYRKHLQSSVGTLCFCGRRTLWLMCSMLCSQSAIVIWGKLCSLLVYVAKENKKRTNNVCVFSVDRASYWNRKDMHNSYEYSTPFEKT